MKFINTDGMAILGPGSEWFWAAAQFIVVVVSLLGIYRQLRGQGAANALQRLESLQKSWDSDDLRYSRLVLALHLKYEGIGSSTIDQASPIMNFFETLSNLEEEGYIGLKELAYGWGVRLPTYWALLEPVVKQDRLDYALPQIYGGFERLNTLLQQFEGLTHLQLDASGLSHALDGMIQGHTEALRQKLAWRSGVIPTAPATVTPEAGPDEPGLALTT